MHARVEGIFKMSRLVLGFVMQSDGERAGTARLELEVSAGYASGILLLINQVRKDIAALSTPKVESAPVVNEGTKAKPLSPS